MKYRLKDQELQRHLDAISGGDFTDVLNANDLEFDEDGLTEIAFGSSAHGKTFIAEKFSVTLLKDEISFQYDPDDWNACPEVTPPEGVRMRVELETSEGDIYRKCAIFENGNWWTVNESTGKSGCFAIEVSCMRVKRFRPWE